MSTLLIDIAESAERHAHDEFHSCFREIVDAAAPPEALDDSLIAELPDDAIDRMERDELVRVVDAARLPLPPEFGADRLRLRETGLLRRLAFLARLCCRNRVVIQGGRCAGARSPGT